MMIYLLRYFVEKR